MAKNDEHESDDDIIERRLKDLADQTGDYPKDLKKGTELEYKFRVQQLIDKQSDADDKGEKKDKPA